MMAPSSLRRRLARSLVASALALAPCVALAPSAAIAQSGDLDALRRRFTQAISLEEKGDWAGAKREFEEIGRVKMTAQVRFHIALCDKGLGNLATAHEGFTAALALAEADPENGADVLESAREQLAELEPRVPRIRLAVENGGSAEVSIDDGPVRTARASFEARVNPGTHTVKVARVGAQPFIRKFNGEEGSLTEFTIPETDAPKPDTTPPPPPPPEALPVVEPGDPIPAIAVGASGAALLVGAAIFLGLRQSTLGEIEDGCDDPDTLQGCDPALADTVSRGEVWNGLTWGLGATGLAALGVGAALYFTVGQDRTVVRNGPVAVTIGPARLSIELEL